VPAIKDAIRAGIMTGPEAIREQGYDPEQHLDEIQAFNQMLDARNIKLDCDPRIEAAAKQQKIEANNVNTDANNP
jgi:capsid protein